DLAKADTALMIGDVMKRLPVTGRRLYRVQANGGRLLYLGPESYTAVQADTAVITDEYTKIPEGVLQRTYRSRKSGCDVSRR
ncbi:MAG TPA: hypothetical protein O0X38_07185, partial [Methanocorpusculum sp.]|nr:hypothetical protein [Methanocorpusculum sp.]